MIAAPMADLGGGGFQIDRLVALRDVHLLAPSKTMTARERLDADFVDAPPTPVASAPATKAESTPNSPAVNADPPQAQSQAQARQPGSAPSPEPVAAQNPEQTQSTEPPMTGSAERVWAKIVQAPGIEPRRRIEARSRATKTTSTAAAPRVRMPKCERFGCGATSPCTKIPRPARPRGKRPPAKPSISTTAARTRRSAVVYQRDPSEKTRRPGPHPARPSRER